MNTMRAQQPYIGDEQNLAVQLNRQDSREFEDVVSQSLPALYRRAYRFVGDPHDAEDAVQDALLSAYKHLDQFKGNAKMATWLTSIVTNSALTQLRRRPRQPHVSLDERLDEEQDYCVSDRLADTKPSPENECIQSELLGHLMRFVAQLSPSLRKVVQLRHLDGFTTDEAAQTLGVAEGTVKAQVSRARSKLRQMARAV
jgi:RNA polymerase sigma-70 factor, ECF subfamily